MGRSGGLLIRVGASFGLVAGFVACDSTAPLPPAVFLEPSALTLEDGQTAKISAKLRNPKARTVRWSSSNPAVATVDAAGNVTGVINGTADVTAKMTDDSTVTATVPVTVSGPPIGTITVTPATATVYVGLALRFTPQLRTLDGRVIRGRTVAWTTADAAIADVSAQGTVRGRGPGGPIAIVASSEGRSATSLVRVAHLAELCPFVAQLPLGQRVDGRLTLGDCEFSLDDSYVDVYEITIPTQATLQIDMTSSEIDSYIGFFSGAGVFLAEDDNSGGERNARLITTPLDPGKYRVWANSAGATVGGYSLTVTQRSAAASYEAAEVVTGRSRFQALLLRRE